MVKNSGMKNDYLIEFLGDEDSSNETQDLYYEDEGDRLFQLKQYEAAYTAYLKMSKPSVLKLGFLLQKLHQQGAANQTFSEIIKDAVHVQLIVDFLKSNLNFEIVKLFEVYNRYTTIDTDINSTKEAKQLALQEAINGCLTAIEINDNYYYAWYLLGRFQQAANQLDEAIISYDQAIRLQPTFADAWYFSGRVFHLSGDMITAKKAFEWCQKICPTDQRFQAAANLFEECVVDKLNLDDNLLAENEGKIEQTVLKFIQ